MSSLALGGFSMKNLSLCYDEAFGIPFDLSLEISNGYKVEELKVHKFVFALHSNVLAKKIRKSVNSSMSISLHGDIEALKVIVKFCYNFSDPLNNKSIQLLVKVYKEAEKLGMSDLQVCFLSFSPPSPVIQSLKCLFTTRSWF